MDQAMNMVLSQDQVILELIALLRQNQRKDTANDVFEMTVYIDGMERKLDAVMEELVTVKKQLIELQEKQERKSLKESLSKAVETLEQQCHIMKEQLFKVKAEVKTKAADIVAEVKRVGKKALNRVAEFLGIKEKLEQCRQNVQESIAEVDKTIEKIDVFGKSMRDAMRQISNTFRTFADKETVDYEKVEKEFSKTEVVKSAWKFKRTLLSGIELRLDAAIHKIEQLSKDVELTRVDKRDFEGADKVVITMEKTISLAEKTGYQYGSEVFDKYEKQQASEVVGNRQLDMSLDKNTMRNAVQNSR